MDNLHFSVAGQNTRLLVSVLLSITSFVSVLLQI